MICCFLFLVFIACAIFHHLLRLNYMYASCLEVQAAICFLFHLISVFFPVENQCTPREQRYIFFVSFFSYFNVLFYKFSRWYIFGHQIQIEEQVNGKKEPRMTLNKLMDSLLYKMSKNQHFGHCLVMPRLPKFWTVELALFWASKEPSFKGSQVVLMFGPKRRSSWACIANSLREYARS